MFMNENFLLKTETARELFFEAAKDEPIFDFHCHLSPKALYENIGFADLTEAWLGGDHYKWRLMRGFGIDEELITGRADSLSKFTAFAKVLSYSPGNPVYHWAHLELQRYFGITQPLNEKTAMEIYEATKEQLTQKDFRVRDFVLKSNVKIIYTTDDPVDDLKYHGLLKNEGFAVTVSPAFRPDKALNITLGFADYINELEKASGISVHGFASVCDALKNRIDFFDTMGCKASDHAFTYIPFSEATDAELDKIVNKALQGKAVTKEESDKYRTALMKFLAQTYYEKDWAMEIHYGVLRNNNSRMFKALGPDTGYDAVGDFKTAENLCKLLDSCYPLPKTILFNINTNDNAIIAGAMGCFQTSGEVSRLQLGTAWWFNDHIDGITSQIRTLANYGVLGKFIGMLTDSRSFLSYPRHEYFRRILCGIVGQWIEDGEYHYDKEIVKGMIKGICYSNALEYFGEMK